MDDSRLSQLPPKKTKIVCTIGPASETREVLESMINGGMDVARLNFAHGDLESHERNIEQIRSLSKTVGKLVAIFGDLPGPKIRIGSLNQESVFLDRGQNFILQSAEIHGDASRVSINYGGVIEALEPGDRISINDGFIQLVVVNVVNNEIHSEVLVGGELRANKGVNLPGVDLGISSFTETDHEFLRFCAAQGLDGVSQSFVQDPEDVLAVRNAANDLDYYPFIVAKIERSKAVQNIDAILEAADGIMIARGDLGVEIPIEEIAVTQKRIIRSANLFGKPVITATHMLESMTINSRPTRAEATDVANAILDGSDCLMLSGETALGNYPTESVNMMSRIAQVTEPNIGRPDLAKILETAKVRGEISTGDLISLSIFLTVEALDPVAVLTPTLSGTTARRVSRYRLPVWIVAISPNEATCRELQFSYGVFPILEPQHPGSWQEYALAWLSDFGFQEGLAVLTQGAGTARVGETSEIDILDLSNPMVKQSLW